VISIASLSFVEIRATGTVVGNLGAATYFNRQQQDHKSWLEEIFSDDSIQENTVFGRRIRNSAHLAINDGSGTRIAETAHSFGRWELETQGIYVSSSTLAILENY